MSGRWFYILIYLPLLFAVVLGGCARRNEAAFWSGVAKEIRNDR